MHSLCLLFRSLCALLFIVGFAATSGCRPPEEIRRYRVAKQATAPVPSAVEQSSTITPPSEDAPPTDRMLAAMITIGNTVWSFKMTGPLDEVSRYAAQFEPFLKSVNFVSAKDPQWETPAGWQQLPPSGMRFATLVPDGASKDLDFSVIVLPAPQDVLLNLNRWRGQLQLPPVTMQGLTSATTRLTVESGEEAVVIDIAGRATGSGMMGPMMARQARPPANQPRENGSSDRAVSLAPPTGWSRQQPRMSQLHVFRLEEADQSAEISIAVLSRAGGALLPNINRWRRQAGLSAWSESEMNSALTARSIGGLEASVVKLIPAEQDSSSRAIIGGIVYREDSAWFFKMSGDAALVAKQEVTFETFLDSIEFP